MRLAPARALSVQIGCCELGGEETPLGDSEVK